MSELKKAICSSIKKYYGEVCVTNVYEGGICCGEMYYGCQKFYRPDEIKFNYISGTIYLTVNGRWSEEHFISFLKNTIGNKIIIDAINSGQISLKFAIMRGDIFQCNMLIKSGLEELGIRGINEKEFYC